MKEITKSYEIEAPVEKVWAALTDPEEIDIWGGGPAVMDDKEGTEFSLWGGDIYGTNKEIVPKKKIVQDWFGGSDWEEPSIVVISLKEKGNFTHVNLRHTNIPDGALEDFDAGWDDYYLGAIKDYLEHA